jgi:hypothetical protein
VIARPAELGSELAEVMAYLAQLEFLLPDMPDKQKHELRSLLTDTKPKLRRLANGN